MPSSASNCYSVLSEEDSEPTDVRFEMEDLQGPRAKREQTQTHEVSGVSASRSVTYLIAFGLQLDREAVTEEVHVSSKAMEMGEASANSLTKGLGVPVDEVTNLFRHGSTIVDMSLICRQGNTYTK